MTFATGARHGLSYIAETVFGATPETPSMTRLRHTACSLGLEKTTLQSEEIRDDRQIAHLLHGQKSVTGDIDVELSYGAFDALLAGLMQSDWDDDVLKAGVTQPSFTFERAFRDIGSYQVFTGCIVSRLRLTVRPDRLIGGRFSILGRSMSLESSALDATPAAGAAHDPMTGFKGAITEGGDSLGIVVGLDLEIDNGLEAAFTLGEVAATDILAGQSRITGEISSYFEDASLLEKFVDETESSLTLTLEGAGGELALALPRLVYTGGSLPALGTGPVTLSLPFTALYDESAGSNLVLTRTPDA
tara:strand:- start:246 stop:1154 length:909 start_codon:yes stop_codon:yes gene_type:complete